FFAQFCPTRPAASEQCRIPYQGRGRCCDRWLVYRSCSNGGQYRQHGWLGQSLGLIPRSRQGVQNVFEGRASNVFAKFRGAAVDPGSTTRSARRVFELGEQRSGNSREQVPTATGAQRGGAARDNETIDRKSTRLNSSHRTIS